MDRGTITRSIIIIKENSMSYPVCGKCHSFHIYLDKSPKGWDEIGCVKCGNRYPGGEGFYMSDKRPLNESKRGVKKTNIKMVQVNG